MQATDIDFTAASDGEIVEFIVGDLAVFHEKQEEAAEKRRDMLDNLAEGAFFVRSRHGFALVLPSTDIPRYAVLNYLFSCATGHGTLVMEQVKEACKHAPFVALRCYTDELRDYYEKRGFVVKSSDGGYTIGCLSSQIDRLPVRARRCSLLKSGFEPPIRSC